MEYLESYLDDFMQSWGDGDGSDNEASASPADAEGIIAALAAPVDAAAGQPMVAAPGTPTNDADQPQAVAAPIKRRRLTTKTAAASTAYPAIAAQPRHSSSSAGDAWKRRLKADLGYYWGKRTVNIFGERIVAPWLSRNHPTVALRDVNYRDLWEKMSDADQKRWLMSLLPGQPQPADDELHYANFILDVRGVSGHSAVAKFGTAQPFITSGALLTWNGDFGLFDNAEVRAVWMNLEMTQDEKTKALWDIPQVSQIFMRFDAFINAEAKRVGFDKVSTCLEASFGSFDVGRVHFHAALSHLRSRYELKNQLHPESWIYRGSKPVVKKNAAIKPQMSTMLINQMHYYVQAPKLGHIYHETNYESAVEFKQESKWVLELWQVRKMSSEAAKAQLYKGRNRVRGSIQEIELVARREEADRLRLEKLDVDRRLAAVQRPWITPPLVSEWKMQYQLDSTGKMINWGKLARFKFLVLHGPSRTGKTSFAKALWGYDKTHFVPCQGVDEPNMKGFDRRQHQAVVFDECNSAVVLRCKALFQANSDLQQLGQSQCNQHCYEVWLYAVPLIVCTNTWLSDIPESDTEGLEWLASNSYYLHVEHPMYQASP